MRRNFLQSSLAKESRAYGFTIAFWGSGALLVKYQGLPELNEAIMYGVGAITGFALLTLYAYRNTFQTLDYEDTDIMVLGMIHYFAALIPIFIAYFTSRLSSPGNFFLTGMSVSLFYNFGMIVEEKLSEEGKRLENYLYKKLGY